MRKHVPVETYMLKRGTSWNELDKQSTDLRQNKQASNKTKTKI